MQRIKLKFIEYFILDYFSVDSWIYGHIEAHLILFLSPCVPKCHKRVFIRLRERHQIVINMNWFCPFLIEEVIGCLQQDLVVSCLIFTFHFFQLKSGIQVLGILDSLLDNVYIFLICHFGNNRAYFFYSCHWNNFSLPFLRTKPKDEFP